MTDKTIKPKLKDVDPLLNFIVMVFIWLNFIIGWSILLQAPNPSLIVINSYFLTYVWAAVFFGLGAGLLYAKLVNDWALIKLLLSVGLFIKSIFTYALIVIGFKYGFQSTIGVTGLWVAVTALQFGTVRNFDLPGGKYVK